MKSAPPDPVGRAAGSLLLELLEQQAPLITTRAFKDHFPKLEQELLGSGLLLPWGSELADVADEGVDDRPVSVLPALNGGGLGRFSGADGWVAVPARRLARYRADIPKIIGVIAGALNWRSSLKPEPLVGKNIWELGSASILRRAVTDVWFVRRLTHEPIRSALADQASRCPARGVRLVLTSTREEDLVGDAPDGHMLVSVHDVRAKEHGLAVDRAIIAARLAGAAGPPSGQALYLSPDGRLLIIHGTIRFAFRSRIQIAIIRRLVEAHRGHCGCTASELLESAGSQAKSLDQAFGPTWHHLRDHLDHQGGAWRFRL